LFLCWSSSNQNVRLGLQVIPEFHVSQNEERLSVLKLFVETLDCGIIKRNAQVDSRDKTFVYVVKRHEELYQKVLPFFEIFPIRSEKHQEFLKFAEVVRLMHKKEHLTSIGVKKILEIAFSMNGAKYRKNRLENLLQILEPSETICQALQNGVEDIVRTA